MGIDVDHQRLAINPESELIIDCDRVGDQAYPLLIVDNLYQDPDYVRQTALELEFGEPQRTHPGQVAKLETELTPLHALVCKYVAHEFGYDEQTTASRSSFSGFTFMKIHRKREDLTVHQCRPHADPVRIAGLIYLNLPEQCAGGTAFYRHRVTGVEEAILPKKSPDKFDKTFIRKATELGAFKGYEKYCQEMFRMPYMDFVRNVLTTLPRKKDYLVESNEDWEMTRKVDMKFNRLICYPGFLLHSGYYRDEWFGSEPENQRLTQNIFVN